MQAEKWQRERMAHYPLDGGEAVRMFAVIIFSITESVLTASPLLRCHSDTACNALSTTTSV